MFEKNKTLSLAAVGLILGAILGSVVQFESMNMYAVAAVGGVIGFLVGWVWQSQAQPDAAESPETSEE